MAIETYPVEEDDVSPTWGTYLGDPNGKPICRCLRLVENNKRAVRAYQHCKCCKGFGFPAVPFEDVRCPS